MQRAPNLDPVLRPRDLHLVSARALGAVAVLLAATPMMIGCQARRAGDQDRPDLPSAVVAEGRRKLAVGDFDGARAHWEQAARDLPGSVLAQRGLQDVRLASDGAEAAIAGYETAARASESGWLDYYLLGRAWIGDPARATAAFQRAATLGPEEPWPVIGLAFVASSSGDFFRAIEVYEEGLRRMPRSANLHLQTGRLFLELHLLMDAQRHLEIARVLRSGAPEIEAEWGRFLARRGRHSSALPILEATAEQHPEIEAVLPDLAATYHALGRPREALSVLDRIAERGMLVDPRLAAAVGAAILVAETP